MSEVLKNKIKDLAKELSDKDNEIMVLAEETGDMDVLVRTAQSLLTSAAMLESLANSLEGPSKKLDPEDLDEIASFATALDKSGNKQLQKQAAVIDQLLLNFGVAQTPEQAAKAAEETELGRLRRENRAKETERKYHSLAQEQKEDYGAEESAKAIKDSVQRYRPLETSLSTRYCPDHPGTSVIRVGDNVYQCPLDKKIYDWAGGFETLKGNQVPGSSVENQTDFLGDRKLEETHFSTRESRLGEND